MNLHERALGVLSCRYVDEVVIGAPWEATEEQIKELGIHHVVAGSIVTYPPGVKDPYATAKRLGMFRTVQGNSDLTTEKIIQRILKNRLAYEQRNKLKQAGEVKIQEQESKTGNYSAVLVPGKQVAKFELPTEFDLSADNPHEPQKSSSDSSSSSSTSSSSISTTTT